jgi:hypothetical protein
MLEELQNELDRLAEKQNNTDLPEFEGYSPNEMHQILYQPFTDGNPIEFNKLSDEEYLKIPIIKQVLYLANIIMNAGELKLTQKGYLPVKVVGELCDQKFLPDEYHSYPIKVKKESDSEHTFLARGLLEQSGIIKKRYNKLSLTKSGEKLLTDTQKFFRKIWDTYTIKVNWAYFDGYTEEPVGQFGYSFSLILLQKYGQELKLDKFYGDKYYDAFPMIYQDYAPEPYSDPITTNIRCYSIRTFDRFLYYFGLIEIEQERWDADKFIRKAELFDRLIRVRKPKGVN